MISCCISTAPRILFGMLVAISTTAIALGQTALPLRDLPPPPPELQKLIEIGSVTFTVGPEDTSDSANRTSDSSQTAKASAGGTTARPPQRGTALAAKTHYEIGFDFRTETTWQLLPNQREVNIEVRLKNFQWHPKHVVWFRESPVRDDFWSRPLVLHEFDHVRLSVDPRWKSQFDELRKKPMTIRHQVSDREPLTPQRIREIADQYVYARFQEALDLIEIRYQELDRQTNHGLRPLEKDSELYPLLRAGGRSEAER